MTDGERSGVEKRNANACRIDHETETETETGSEEIDRSHLEDVDDGCGCTEIWEHLSEQRSA